MEKELELLVRGNNRRDDRLKRVRHRDYSNKYKMAEVRKYIYKIN